MMEDNVSETKEKDKCENEKQCPKQHKNKKPVIQSITNVIFFVIIPLFIVLLLTFKTVHIYDLVLQTGGETINAEQAANLGNSNMLDIGIAVVSLAVSVWLGINIANLVDRQTFEQLRTKLDEVNTEIANFHTQNEQKIQEALKQITDTEKKIEDNVVVEVEKIKSEINNEVLYSQGKIQKIVFLNEMLKTKEKYIVSEKLYTLFMNRNDQEETAIIYPILYEIECLYTKCTDAYEEYKWGETFSSAKQALIKLNSYLENPDSYRDDTIRLYFATKKADFLFYKNMPATHSKAKLSFSEKELLDSISIYEEVKKHYCNDNDFFGFICNTIGYTYDILSLHGSETNRKVYLTKAINYMKVATENCNKGRFYRNLGLTYQHNNDFENAKKSYREAIKQDPNDVKAYNTMVSLILREIDRLYGMENRAKVDEVKMFFELEHIDSKLQDSVLQKLDEVELFCGFLENDFFTDSQFNLCKFNMYKYIVGGYKNEHLIRKAIKDGNRALILNPDSDAAKFSLRNAYEAWNKIDQAKEIAKMLEDKGDNKRMKEIYSNL